MIYLAAFLGFMALLYSFLPVSAEPGQVSQPRSVFTLRGDAHVKSAGLLNVYLPEPDQNLSQLLGSIGKDDCDLVIDREIAVVGETTVPPNVDVHLVGAGMLRKTPGSTLNIEGGFSAGLRRVFVGFDPGDVTFGSSVVDVTESLRPPKGGYPRGGKVNRVYAQWWGAYSGPTDDRAQIAATTRAINSAITSLNPSRAIPAGDKDKRYRMKIGPGGTVHVFGQFYVDGTIYLRPKVNLAGDGTAMVLDIYNAYSQSQSLIKCMQQDGSDCVAVTSDVGLLDPSTCEPKAGYHENQFELTKPNGTTISGVDIMGDPNTQKGGHGIVIGAPARRPETFDAICERQGKPLRSDAAYDSVIEKNRIWYHGGLGIRISNAATARIINNYIGHNKWSGLLSVRVSNGHLLQGNHFQANCADPRGYDTKCAAIRMLNPYGVVISGNTLEDGEWTADKNGLVKLTGAAGVSYQGNYHEIGGTQNIVTNGRFAHGLDGWTYEASETVVVRASGPDRALKIIPLKEKELGKAHQAIRLAPGSKYGIRYCVRTEKGSFGRVLVSESLSKKTLFDSGPLRQEVRLCHGGGFNVGRESAGTVSLETSRLGPEGAVLFDNVQIGRVDTMYGLILEGHNAGISVEGNMFQVLRSPFSEHCGAILLESRGEDVSHGVRIVANAMLEPKGDRFCKTMVRSSGTTGRLSLANNVVVDQNTGSVAYSKGKDIYEGFDGLRGNVVIEE